MRNGDASVVSSLFGAPGQVEVERGLAEFRGGRPVRVTTGGQSVVALPVDGTGPRPPAAVATVAAPGQSIAALPVGGIDARRLAAFATFAAPALPRLVVTSRRARALGLDVSEPVAIALDGSEDIERIEALIAAVAAPRPLET